MTEQAQEVGMKWHQQPRWRLAIAAAIVLLIVGWRAGTFDDVLVHVGLNAKPCIRNAYGTTFCGSSATSYCESLPHGGSGSKMCEQLGTVSLGRSIEQEGHQAVEEYDRRNEQPSQKAAPDREEELQHELNEDAVREASG